MWKTTEVLNLKLNGRKVVRRDNVTERDIDDDPPRVTHLNTHLQSISHARIKGPPGSPNRVPHKHLPDDSKVTWEPDRPPPLHMKCQPPWVRKDVLLISQGTCLFWRGVGCDNAIPSFLTLHFFPQFTRFFRLCRACVYHAIVHEDKTIKSAQWLSNLIDRSKQNKKKGSQIYI